MEREEFVNRSWKAYQSVLYQHDRMPLPIECLVSEIDFDAEILIVQPLHEFFKKEDIAVNIKHITIPKKKVEMKIVK